MKLLTARTQEFIEASEGIIAHSKGMDDRMWKAEYLLEVYKVEQLTQIADTLDKILGHLEIHEKQCQERSEAAVKIATRVKVAERVINLEKKIDLIKSEFVDTLKILEAKLG